MSNIFYRTDGRVEWLCPHGVGHTIAVPAAHVDSDARWTHGCDGCCMPREEWEAAIEKWEAAIKPSDPPPPPPRREEKDLSSPPAPRFRYVTKGR